MTDTQPFMDEALALWATLPKESAGIHAIATALSSAYQRGREEERERCVQFCFARGHERHRQAKQYEAQDDEGSQVGCLAAAVEAMDIAAAIRTERDKG